MWHPLPFLINIGDAPNGHCKLDLEKVCVAKGIDFNALLYNLLDLIKELFFLLLNK